MLVNKDFYLNDYGGEIGASGDENGLERLLCRAQRDVWCVCAEGLWNAVYEGNADERQTRILKTAVCVQADFLGGNSGTGNDAESVGNSGGDSDSGGAVTESENKAAQTGGVISSVKLGDFSVNYNYSSAGSADGTDSENKKTEEKSDKKSGSDGNKENDVLRGNVCSGAWLLLDRGGFLYRGGVKV